MPIFGLWIGNYHNNKQKAATTNTTTIRSKMIVLIITLTLTLTLSLTLTLTLIITLCGKDVDKRATESLEIFSHFVPRQGVAMLAINTVLWHLLSLRKGWPSHRLAKFERQSTTPQLEVALPRRDGKIIRCYQSDVDLMIRLNKSMIHRFIHQLIDWLIYLFITQANLLGT